MTSGTRLAIVVIVVVLVSAAFLYSRVQREIAYQDCVATQAALSTSAGGIVAGDPCAK